MTEYQPTLSADISVDMSTDTWSSVGQASINMLVTYRPICRPSFVDMSAGVSSDISIVY